MPSTCRCQKKASRFSMTHRPPTNTHFANDQGFGKHLEQSWTCNLSQFYRMVMSPSVFYHLLSDFSNCSLCVRFWLCLCCDRMASTSQTRCCDAMQRRKETQMSSCRLWRSVVDICPIFRLTPATFTCEAPCTVPTVSNAAAGGICKEAVGRILEWESRYCNQMAKQQNIAFVAIDIATATLVPTLNMHAYEHVRSKHVALTPFLRQRTRSCPSLLAVRNVLLATQQQQLHWCCGTILNLPSELENVKRIQKVKGILVILVLSCYCCLGIHLGFAMWCI